MSRADKPTSVCHCYIAVTEESYLIFVVEALFERFLPICNLSIAISHIQQILVPIIEVLNLTHQAEH